ncbi:RCC1-like G exchanging factor-like protein [Diadema antillarum]|uniref:RCC1-like G exchanging factor-like protein n=1 Tax=Diadema antillarum TaxID=105358 RepID=UPI003A8C5D66
MSLTQVHPPLLLRACYTCSCLVLPKTTPSLSRIPSQRQECLSQRHFHCATSTANSSLAREQSSSFSRRSQLRTLTSVGGKKAGHEMPDSMSRNPEGKDVDIMQLVGKHRKRYTSVYSWGFTYTGALGVPAYFFPTKRKNAIRKPKKFQSTPYKLKFDEKITTAACGYGFTLIGSNTLDTQKVWGMGINTNSQLGYQPKAETSVEGMHTIISPTPIHLPLMFPRKTRVTQVDCGRAHSLILTDEEGVFSLGNNAHGQCGRPVIENEDYSSNKVVHNIKGIEGKVTQIACGHDHSLFLTDAGHVYSCGWGADGQTGLGHYGDTSIPKRLEGDIKDIPITQISTFADCCLAISDQGELFGWGNSEYNQLKCITEETQVYEPRHIPFKEVGKVTSASTGGTICALTNDAGEVWVWGYGFLGRGPKLTDTATPECIDMNLFGKSPSKTDVAVSRVWCGLHYFAAVTNKGDLYTWGTNGSGCLGLGQLHSQYFPLKVSLPGQVTHVACGVDHTLALVKKDL